MTLLPTIPGCVEGIVGRDPWQLQCGQCGSIEEPGILVLMKTKFHRGWEGRWCRDCRLAKNCNCWNCNHERGTRRG